MNDHDKAIALKGNCICRFVKIESRNVQLKQPVKPECLESIPHNQYGNVTRDVALGNTVLGKESHIVFAFPTTCVLA